MKVSFPNPFFAEENDYEVNFDLDPSNKNFLMEGLDDIGLTLKDADLIKSYEKKAESNLPCYSM